MTNTEKILKEFDEKLHAIATDCWANINDSLQKSGAKFKGDGIGTAYGGWVALNQILIPRVSFLLAESIHQAIAEERDRMRGEIEKVKFTIYDGGTEREVVGLEDVTEILK